MLRFVSYALPLLVLLLALFGFAVEVLDVEPRSGSVIKLALFDQPMVPAQLVFGTWLVEASGLLALFLLAQGRCGAWWLDGLVAGWLAWVFRGPLLVVTIVVAARQPHYAWWTLAFGWWVLYSVCGLSLSILARRTELDLAIGATGASQRHEMLKAQREAEAAQALPEISETEEAPVDEGADVDGQQADGQETMDEGAGLLESSVQATEEAPSVDEAAPLEPMSSEERTVLEDPTVPRAEPDEER